MRNRILSALSIALVCGFAASGTATWQGCDGPVEESIGFSDVAVKRRKQRRRRKVHRLVHRPVRRKRRQRRHRRPNRPQTRRTLYLNAPVAAAKPPLPFWAFMGNGNSPTPNLNAPNPNAPNPNAPNPNAPNPNAPDPNAPNPNAPSSMLNRHSSSWNPNSRPRESILRRSSGLMQNSSTRVDPNFRLDTCLQENDWILTDAERKLLKDTTILTLQNSPTPKLYFKTVCCTINVTDAQPREGVVEELVDNRLLQKRLIVDVQRSSSVDGWKNAVMNLLAKSVECGPSAVVIESEFADEASAKDLLALIDSWYEASPRSTKLFFTSSESGNAILKKCMCEMLTPALRGQMEAVFNQRPCLASPRNAFEIIPHRSLLETSNAHRSNEADNGSYEQVCVVMSPYGITVYGHASYATVKFGNGEFLWSAVDEGEERSGAEPTIGKAISAILQVHARCRMLDIQVPKNPNSAEGIWTGAMGWWGTNFKNSSSAVYLTSADEAMVKAIADAKYAMLQKEVVLVGVYRNGIRTVAVEAFGDLPQGKDANILQEWFQQKCGISLPLS